MGVDLGESLLLADLSRYPAETVRPLWPNVGLSAITAVHISRKRAFNSSVQRQGIDPAAATDCSITAEVQSLLVARFYQTTVQAVHIDGGS